MDYQRVVDRASVVVDTRNATSRTKESRARVVQLSEVGVADAADTVGAAR